MGAYFVLYPDSRISTLVLWFPVRIPAWFYLDSWFLYQFFEGNCGLIHPSNTGGSGVAFFAHVGGFIFGAVVARVLVGRDASPSRRHDGPQRRSVRRDGPVMPQPFPQPQAAYRPAPKFGARVWAAAFTPCRHNHPNHREHPESVTQTIRDDGMQTFSLDPRRWPVGFLVSRCPLVRRSDRLEVLAIAFALAISLLTLPIVATIASDVHQAHRGVYAEQARTRHRASIPTQESTNVAPPSAYPAEGARRWVRNATPQGSPVEQWLDDAGNWVAPPTPLSRRLTTRSGWRSRSRAWW
jgi:hypothetical protein